MAPLVWIPLAFLLAALIGSITFAALRAWRAWRTFRSFQRRALAAVADVLRTAEAAEAHATALTEGGERLTHATAQLQDALAELAALRAAGGEASALFGAAAQFVPRK